MSVTDEVKQRIDIVEFIGRYTPLKRSGATYKGLCPFHGERTPSFIVFPHTGTWRCFGACGIGGDVFTFLMQKENVDFREALQMLAREVGVDLEAAEGREGAGERATLYTINDAAAAYFQEVLRHHPAAEAARAYLVGRGLDEETRARFRLGFALESWSSLRDHLSERGYSLAQQLDAGLVKQNETRERTYDAFRNRVMIPISDRQGRTIGFGGRVMDKSEPKYLNTAETPLFQKSRVIYGLDLAGPEIRSANQVVIVEGYMDVIAAHQHGFTNVVACMGTSLTAEQLQQLQRYTNHFVLALDADAAGQQATIRGLNQARQALGRVQKPIVTASGIRMEARLSAQLSICAMPDGQDPDDVIRRRPDGWRQLVAAAQPLVDFYFDNIARQYDLSTVQGKGQAVAELAPLIAELHDEIEQQHYVDQLSRWVRIDEQTIWERVRAAARTGQLVLDRSAHRRSTAGEGRRAPQPPISSAPGGAPGQEAAFDTRPSALLFGREEYLLACLLLQPNLLVSLSWATGEREIAPLGVADLLHVENQELFRALKQYMGGEEPWDVEAFQEMLTPHLHGRLADLMAYGARLPQRNDEQLAEDLVQTLIRIRIERIRVESQNIKFLEDEAIHQGDMAGSKAWSDVKNRHLRELSHLQQEAVRILPRGQASGRGVRAR